MLMSAVNSRLMEFWFGSVEEFDFYLTREAIKGAIPQNAKREAKKAEGKAFFVWLVKTDNNQV